MGRTLYWECQSGISGDMAVASLLDLGVDESLLRQTLATLPLEGYYIEISRVKKAGLDACDFNVILDAAYENHDHDMEYLYGHTHHEHTPDEHTHHEHTHHEHTHHEHTQDEHAQDEHTHHEHAHDHHEHVHDHHSHIHEHRSLSDVVDILSASGLSERAKTLAIRIFTILGEAEAKAHGATLETVHFHEVGAIDSIVDIAAVAICLDWLDITEVIIPKLVEGTGTIRCAHGILPVPVPAVAAIAAMHQIPLAICETKGELVTPTGAAIVAATRTQQTLPESMVMEAIGLGAGKRTYDRPSILRAILLAKEQSDASSDASPNEIIRMESNVDDCTGEEMGLLMELLFAAGALDVHYIPVYMKKNRPAYELVVICDASQTEALANLIFTHSTTIGIRYQKMERFCLPRKKLCVQTPYGLLHVKEVILPDGGKRRYPEYEDVAKVVREGKEPYHEVYHKVMLAAQSAPDGAKD